MDFVCRLVMRIAGVTICLIAVTGILAKSSFLPKQGGSVVSFCILQVPLWPLNLKNSKLATPEVEA